MSTNNTASIRFCHALNEAEGYFELEMYEHSLDILQKLDQRLSKENLGALYLRGECLRILDRYCEAWKVLEEVASERPGNIYVLVSLAWSQKRAGRIDLACNSIQEALEFEPNNPLLHFNVSCYYSLLGIKKKALEHLHLALVLDPSFQSVIPGEPDFDPMRKEPEFLSLVGSAV